MAISLFENSSVYAHAEPSWDLANELLQADTKEQLEKFAESHPQILDGYRDNHVFFVPSYPKGLFATHVEEDEHLKYAFLTLTDYRQIQSVLTRALNIKQAVDNKLIHSSADLEALGISYKLENECSYELEIVFEPDTCVYKEWLRHQQGGSFCGAKAWAPALTIGDKNIYETAALYAFDTIVNNHLAGAHLGSWYGSRKIYVSSDIAAVWLGVLEKLNGKDSYIGVCKNCGKLFIAEKARSHKREFCNNDGKCRKAWHYKQSKEKRREQKNGKNEK